MGRWLKYHYEYAKGHQCTVTVWARTPEEAETKARKLLAKRASKRGIEVPKELKLCWPATRD